MLFIVRQDWPGLGLTAHIPDVDRRTLCGVEVQASGWRMVDVPQRSVSSVCSRCRKLHERMARAADLAAASVAEPA